MARPRKTGIEYFSVDVDIMSDRKIRRVIRKCRTESFAVIMQILCLAYSENGYYLEIDDNLTFDLSDSLNMDEKKVKDAISECVNADFFDETMYENHNILTSKRMQLNYKQATEKRVNNKIRSEYDLISTEENLVSEEETAFSEEETHVSWERSTQRKEQHNKVQDSIEKAANNADEANCAREEITQVELNSLGRAFEEVSDKDIYEYSRLRRKYGFEAVKDALVKTMLSGGKRISYTATILNEHYTEISS